MTTWCHRASAQRARPRSRSARAPGTVAPLAYVRLMELEFAIVTAQPAPVGLVPSPDPAACERAARPVNPVYLRPRWGDVVAEWACPVCGISCNRTYHSGRARVYCTNACRQRAYRLRRRAIVGGRPCRHRSRPRHHTRRPARPALRRAISWPAAATPRVARSRRAGRSHAPRGIAHRWRGTRISSPAGRGRAGRAPPSCTSSRRRWRRWSNAPCGGPPCAEVSADHRRCSARLQCSHGEQQTAPGNTS